MKVKGKDNVKIKIQLDSGLRIEVDEVVIQLNEIELVVPFWFGIVTDSGHVCRRRNP